MFTMQQQAMAIESVFRAHNVGCRVAPPPSSFQTSGYNAFTFQRGVGLKVSSVTGLSPELEEALGQPVRFSHRPLTLEVARPDPQRLPLLALWPQLKSAQATGLPMATGQTVEGGRLLPQRVNLADPNTPHVLVAGTTGSGKTILLQSMLLSAAAMQSPGTLSIVVLDPKGVDFRGFYGLPHLAHNVISDPAECVQALAAVVAELERRKAAGMLEPEQRIVVAIDELADLMDVAGKDVEGYIRRIIQVGRGLGVALVAATQQPLAAILGSVVKANFPLRMVGKVSSDTEAKTAAGIYHTGAERLPGKGAFLSVNGTTHRIQAYHCAGDEQMQLVGAIGQRWGGGKAHYSLRLDAPVNVGRAVTVAPVAAAAAVYKAPVVGSVKLTRPVYATFAEHFDKATGELAYGGMAAMVRACFGDGAPTGGNYRQQAQKVVDYLKTTTTTGVVPLQ